MKVKFEKWFRGLLVLLLVFLFWSVWNGRAQTASNAVPAAVAGVTNGPSDAGLLARLGAEQNDLVQKVTDYLTTQFPFLNKIVWGNPVGKYLASLLYIFLAFYVSKLLDFLTRIWLRRWAERTDTKFDDLLLNLLNGPIKVVTFVIFLHIGLSMFSWPPKVELILNKGFTVIVAVTLTYMVLKFTDLALGFWRQRAMAGSDRSFNDQLFPIVRKTLKAFVIVVAVLVTAQNLQIDVTAAIASLSIGGLAVGLAAQDTLANLFGAVAVFMDRPFQIGDAVKIDTVEGAVESIGLRSTRLRNINGHLITIPNKTVGNATITNITRRPNIRTEMNIGLTYDTPADKVKRAVSLLEEIYRAHPMTQDLLVNFNRFGDSALNILVVHVWGSLDMGAYLTGMQQLNLTIKERFDKEGISMAFPTQTLYVKQDSEWRLHDVNGAPAAIDGTKARA